jgi:acetyl esterase/lipase
MPSSNAPKPFAAPLWRGIAALCLLLILANCSGKAALDALVPKTGYRLQEGIAYGADPHQKMDLYIPDKLQKPACTVLFFYGGRWSGGSRDLYRFAGQAFAARGCVTAVADYRLYPQVRYPLFLEDSAKAFVYLHRHAREFGGDPDRMFLAGHSAGAYNAVMLAVDPAYIKAAGGKASWVKGAIGIAGPYDFLPFTDADVIDIFSTEKNKPLTQPIDHVRPGLPPLFLAHGLNDGEVLPKNTINMARKLREAGDPVTVKLYPDARHEAIILSLLDGFRRKIPLLHDIAVFIREH